MDKIKMFNNNRGQAVFLGVMISIMLFITVVALIEPLKTLIVIARDPTHLDCTNTSISVGQAGTCILVDWYMFYFVGVTIAAGIGYITGMGVYNRLRQG